MSKSFYPPRRRITQKLFNFSPTGATPVAGATRYYFLRGFLNAMQFAEVDSQTLFRQRGSLRNLRIWILPGANSATVVLRINGVDQTLIVVTPAGGIEQEVSDQVNDVLVVPNDLVNWRITTGAASPTFYHIEVDFFPEV